MRVFALIPMSEAALRRGRWFNRIVRGLLVLGALLLAIGIATGPPAAWAGLTALIAALLVLTIGWPSVWPTGQVQGEWVWLSFVDAGFAGELGCWYRRQATSLEAACEKD